MKRKQEGEILCKGEWEGQILYGGENGKEEETGKERRNDGEKRDVYGKCGVMGIERRE